MLYKVDKGRIIKLMEIRDITKEAVIINEDSTFRDAIALMVSKQTNSLIIVNEDGELSGELKVSDLLDAIVPEYLDGDSIAANFATEEMFEEAVKNAEDKQVKEFMSTDIQSVHVDDSLMSIAATAIAHQTAHIPIVDHENRPLGFVSRRGLKHILAKYLGITDSV